MGTVMTMEELRGAGLLDEATEPHLTPKGRDWLRMLEELETREVVDAGEMAADLVMSTSGIYR